MRAAAKVIAPTAAAGAEKEEVNGEDLRVVRVDGVDSNAWKVNEDWVLSLGQVDSPVLAHVAPPHHLRYTLVCHPMKLVGRIRDEANSIVNHFAPLRMSDFAVASSCSTPLASRLAPAAPMNVQHATVAVTALLQAISSPEAGFPVIHALHQGQCASPRALSMERGSRDRAYLQTVIGVFRKIVKTVVELLGFQNNIRNNRVLLMQGDADAVKIQYCCVLLQYQSWSQQ
jgi:hypothetical protein